jgi:hypothetical protein
MLDLFLTELSCQYSVGDIVLPAKEPLGQLQSNLFQICSNDNHKNSKLICDHLKPQRLENSNF